MRKLKLLVSLIAISLSVLAQTFIHPGVLHTQKQFDYLIKVVKEKKEPAYSSYLLLKNYKCSSCDYKMIGPFKVISRDGDYAYTKSKMESDFSAAYLNSIMWMIT